MLKFIASLAIITLVFSRCAQTGQAIRNNPKTTMGGMLAAAGGGLIAAAAGGGTAGIIGGVLLGGLVGGAIGNHLDQKDKEMARQAANRAFEHGRSGERSTWHNPDNGHSGSVTPTRIDQAASVGYCREYQQEIVVGGERQKSYGTACRQPDGSWKIQGGPVSRVSKRPKGRFAMHVVPMVSLICLLFLPAIASAQGAPPTHDPRAAFAASDGNHDGRIDHEEFHHRIVQVFISLIPTATVTSRTAS